MSKRNVSEIDHSKVELTQYRCHSIVLIEGKYAILKTIGVIDSVNLLIKDIEYTNIVNDVIIVTVKKQIK